MGRLMDSILAAVGYKPSDRVDLVAKPSLTPRSNDTSSSNIDQKQAEDLAAQAAAAAANADLTTPTPEASEEVAAYGIVEKIGGKDCTSCKFISLATMLGIGGFYIRETNKQSTKFTGYKKLAMKGQGIFAAAACATVGFARVFEIGPFAKGIEHYDANDHLYADLIQTFAFFNIKPPSFLGLDEWVPPTVEDKKREAEEKKQEMEKILMNSDESTRDSNISMHDMRDKSK